MTMMKSRSPSLSTVPLKMVGSNHFGRYPKISQEQTFNMIVSDGWLVDYAAYKQVGNVSGGEGRGIYSSQRLGAMIVVIDNIVYSVNNGLNETPVGRINTFSGDVFVAENNAKQIAICDKINIWIYNYGTGTFTQASTSGTPGSGLSFLPGYISFQDGYFISVDLNSNRWFLSNPNDGTTWPAGGPNVGIISTKPDTAIAAVPMPGKAGLLLVFGQNVAEPWRDVGYTLFPYQRSNYNFDHGAANAATIAVNDRFMAWLAINQKSGPVVMSSDGSDVKKVSTDGLDFKLSTLTNPMDSYGFFLQQDGHLLYQLTFPTDNVSYVFDFNKDPVEFYSLTDEYMNYHIAKRVAFFNGQYYFVSINDGALYQFGTQFTTLNGAEMPRIRITNTVRMEDSSPFVANNAEFTIEQGVNSSIQAVDMSISKNGGLSFSNDYRKILNTQGYGQNRLNYWDMGQCNELTCQFRFWGTGRFTATNGTVSYYQ